MALLLPLLAEVMVRNAALLTAVHAQLFALAVNVTLPAAAVAGSDADALDNENVHGGTGVLVVHPMSWNVPSTIGPGTCTASAVPIIGVISEFCVPGG